VNLSRSAADARVLHAIVDGLPCEHPLETHLSGVISQDRVESERMEEDLTRHTSTMSLAASSRLHSQKALLYLLPSQGL
jgi:hypothetical protein